MNNANSDKPLTTAIVPMGKHVSIILRDDLWHLMQKRRGRESKSSYLNYAIEQYFRHLDKGE